jgi:hypothetical protein
VKIIFFVILGEDWYRLRQRLLTCIRNLELWDKNGQSMLQGVLFNPGFGWFWKVFAAIGVRGTMTGSRGG